MFIVDTYNVLHSPAAMRMLDDDAGPGELAVLFRAGRHGKDRAVLICDGSPRPEQLGPSAEPRGEFRYRVEGVEIVYAGPGRDADSLIELWIEREPSPRRLKIVSADRRLIRAAKSVRARPIDSSRFLNDLLHDAERAHKRWRRPAFSKEVPLSPDAVRYWHKLFGLDEADVPFGSVAQDPDRSAEPNDQPGASGAASRPRADVVIEPPTHATQKSASQPLPAMPDPLDPILLEALEEWRGRISVDDLDMERWLSQKQSDDSSR